MGREGVGEGHGDISLCLGGGWGRGVVCVDRRSVMYAALSLKCAILVSETARNNTRLTRAVMISARLTTSSATRGW